MSPRQTPPAERPVSEILQREFVSVGAEDQLDFADDVMRLGRIRHLLVEEGGKLVGIVSQRDLLSASLSKLLAFDAQERRTFLRSIRVSEVMTRDVLSVEPETPLAEVARLMVRHKIGCVPALDADGAPVGLVTEADLLRALYGLEA